MKHMSIAISEQDYQKRIDALLAYIHQSGYSGVVLFDRDYILYYTGFAFIPTERPIAFVLNKEGEKVLFVPYLELTHASQISFIERISSYVEYPYEKHPMIILNDLLVELGIQQSIASDGEGYPWIFGYRGSTLHELTGVKPIIIRQFIEDQMMIKNEAEINLIKESVKWGHLAHVFLQRFTRVGLTETEVSLKASNQATQIMLDTIGPLYQAQSPFSSGAHAGYRGQIGRNAAIPHALANNITFQEGDILVTGANAPVWGYNSELERTMIIGNPTETQKNYFSHMLALQEIAFETIKPGIKCSDVDLAVRKYYQEHDLMKYWLHHVGHAIGIRYHEGPFFDLGDHTIIKPGMVFTVEPGLYVPQLGGFRHSDTVLVTDTGLEMLTYYPRDIDSLTIPV